MMHVFMMRQICHLTHDAYVHDAYICDIQFLTMLHVCMMRLKFCGQPTNEQGDSRSRMYAVSAETLSYSNENAEFLNFPSNQV